MVSFFNINGGSTASSGGGGTVSGSVVTEILNDVTGTDVTIGTTISGGTYKVYKSTDGGTTYVLQTEGTNYTRSGQNLTFAVALTSDTIKFEFTYS